MIGTFIAKIQISKGFDAMNRHDLDKFLSAWRDDSTFIYPGDIPASGKFEGKVSIEKWFKNFFEQFPKIKFTLKHICVDKIFDFTGTNTIAVYWNIDLTNQKGGEIHNKGITVLTIKLGKIMIAEDFIFNTGDEFRKIWSKK
jgi:ketosteroid isomerase-like protein